MKRTWTIAYRELNSYFCTPIAYVVLFLYTLLAGVVFVFQFRMENPAELRIFFLGNVWLLIIITPALSMRLISEELRIGTIEPLLTSPISDAAVIVGKWLGAMGFFITLHLPTLAYVIILYTWANPDPGPIISGYMGTLLIGGVYMAMGLFASVLTRNQVIAFLLSVFLIILFTLVPQLTASVLRGQYASKFGPALNYINIYKHYVDFSKGLIDVSDFLFFLTGIAMFLAFAVKALESRKWR